MKKKFKESKLLWYAVSTAILIALVYTADFGEFLDSMFRISPEYMFLSFISGFSVFAIFGYIWFRFFEKIGIDVNLRKSYQLFMAGNFMNSVTPLGQIGGEPFMAYLISKNTDADYEKAFSSVLSADMVNLIPVITYTIIAMIYLLITGLNTPFTNDIISLVMVMIIFSTLVLYMLWFKSDRIEEKAVKLIDFTDRKTSLSSKHLNSIKERINTMKNAFMEVGENPRHLTETALIAHLYPITQFLALYLILLGLGIKPTVIGVCLTVIVSGLAHFSPTPGGAGAFEAAFSGLLMIFFPSIGLNNAVAAAVLFRLTSYWPGIPVGYIALLSLKD